MRRPSSSRPKPSRYRNLNLKLKGTIAADDPQFALAIIADNANREKVYAIDDTIATGTQAARRSKDTRVILNQSGRLTALELPQEYSSGGSSRSNRATSNRTSSSSIRASRGASVRDVVAENVSSLTDVIRPQPLFQRRATEGLSGLPGQGIASSSPTSGFAPATSLRKSTARR